MGTMPSRKQSRELPIEDESFWQHHTERHKVSGLSRKEYCRINNVNYNRFDYKTRKNNKKCSPLMAVKIKPFDSSLKQQPTTPYTLHFRNGIYLQIHDQYSLINILEKLV